MKIGCGLFGTKIYIGSTRKTKEGLELWTKKEDVTREATIAVFEHFHHKAEDTGYYEVTIEGYGTMSFKRVDKDSTTESEAKG